MKKIPDHAKKVFEGIIFDIYHWDQEMFDGSVATFEAVKKRDTVTVAAVIDNKIVLNDEEQPSRLPFTTLPGGLTDKDDADALFGAKRELIEETGLSSDDWVFWFNSDPLHSTKIEWNSYFYIAKNCKKTSDPHLDPGEKINTRYISFEEFLELRNDPAFRNKELLALLEKAANDESEKQTLKELLGIIN